MDLIVIADDLGYYPERDQVIFDCFKNGVVRGSSLLVNGYSAKEAAQQAKKIGLEIGLHLNLTEGCPISDPSLIPSLLKQYEDSNTHERKYIFLGKNEFREAAANNQISLKEVEIETKAQIELFKEYYGSYPVYIDGHQHIHVIPQFTEFFATLFESYHVRYTRMLEDNEEECGYIEHDGRYANHRQYFLFGQQARLIYEAHHLLCPISIGMSIGGHHMSVQRILNLLYRFPREKQQHLVFEMMTHPSVPKDNVKEGGCGLEADSFSQSSDRTHEYSILKSEYLQLTLKEKHINLCSYSESHLGKSDCCIHKSTTVPRILFLVSMKESTGNTITCYRLYHYLLELNYSVFIIDINSLTHDALMTCLARWKPDLLLPIHAYRSGQFLLHPDISTSFLLVLGGTDINVAIQNDSKKETIKKVFQKAKGVVCFTESMKQKMDQFCSDITMPPSYIIPQSCPLEIDLQSTQAHPYNLYHLLPIQPQDLLLVLPSGLRPVKNITFLFEAITLMDKQLFQQEQRHLYLLVVGPILDSNYAKEVFSVLPNDHIYMLTPEEQAQYLTTKKSTVYPTIFYHAPFDHHSFLYYLSSSFACLNTSDSEGQAAVVKECWLARVPILARDNEGNKFTITHSYNGLLYHTPEEFCEQLNSLIHDPSLYHTLVENAYRCVVQQEEGNHEKEQYSSIIKSLLSSS